MQWHPIETAPKDGSIVFLFRPQHGCVPSPSVIVGAFSPDDGKWVWPVGECNEFDPVRWWDEVIEDCYGDDSFTHWAPLHEPYNTTLSKETGPRMAKED